MNNFKLLILFLLSVSGCVLQPTSTSNNEKNTNYLFVAQDDIKKLLSFNHDFINSDQVNQKKKFNEIKQESTKNPKDTTLKINLATMLSLPTSKMKDYSIAKDILEELVNDKSLTESEMTYVETLYAFTLESIKQQQQTKDELKKNELLLQKNESLQRKHDILEKKLTDLKNIERKFIDRDSK